MDWNVYLLIQKPGYQALLFSLLTPILILISQPKSAETPWLIAVYTFAVFLLVNAAFLWFADNSWRYFFYSIGCALGYILFIAVIMPGVLRILRLAGEEGSAMAFLIVIYQPIALLFVMLAKWLFIKWF